jgi:hypothetical protein
MIHSIIRKIFESSFLTKLFGGINVTSIQTESNLWHAHQRRHLFRDGGIVDWL